MVDLEDVFYELEGKAIAIKKDNNLTIIEEFNWGFQNNIYNIENVTFSEYLYIEEHLGDYLIWLNNCEVIIIEVF